MRQNRLARKATPVLTEQEPCWSNPAGLFSLFPPVGCLTGRNLNPHRPAEFSSLNLEALVYLVPTWYPLE